VLFTGTDCKEYLNLQFECSSEKKLKNVPFDKQNIFVEMMNDICCKEKLAKKSLQLL
jgi:hypothetical protein